MAADIALYIPSFSSKFVKTWYRFIINLSRDGSTEFSRSEKIDRIGSLFLECDIYKSLNTKKTHVHYFTIITFYNVEFNIDKCMVLCKRGTCPIIYSRNKNEKLYWFQKRLSRTCDNFLPKILLTKTMNVIKFYYKTRAFI